MQDSRQNQKGFSLIELLIVVVILGLLVGIALPQYGHYLHQGRQKAAMTQLKAISDANELYQVRNGSYAAELSDLVPNFIRQIAEDPWGSEYRYEVTSGGYTLTSLGSDQAPGPVPPPDWVDEPYEVDIVLRDGVFTQAPGHAITSE